MGPAYTLSSNFIIYLHLVKVWILWGHYLSGMTLVIWENDKRRACQMLPALSDVTLPDIKKMVIAINIGTLGQNSYPILTLTYKFLPK